MTGDIGRLIDAHGENVTVLLFVTSSDSGLAHAMITNAPDCDTAACGLATDDWAPVEGAVALMDLCVDCRSELGKL